MIIIGILFTICILNSKFIKVLRQKVQNPSKQILYNIRYRDTVKRRIKKEDKQQIMNRGFIVLSEVLDSSSFNFIYIRNKLSENISKHKYNNQLYIRLYHDRFIKYLLSSKCNQCVYFAKHFNEELKNYENLLNNKLQCKKILGTRVSTKSNAITMNNLSIDNDYMYDNNCDTNMITNNINNNFVDIFMQTAKWSLTCMSIKMSCHVNVFVSKSTEMSNVIGV